MKYNASLHNLLDKDFASIKEAREWVINIANQILMRDERRDYSISKLGKKIEIGSVENGKLRTY